MNIHFGFQPVWVCGRGLNQPVYVWTLDNVDKMLVLLCSVGNQKCPGHDDILFRVFCFLLFFLYHLIVKLYDISFGMVRDGTFQQATFFKRIDVSRWWFHIFFIFTPKIGQDEPILTSIFFRWVGWNDQLVIYCLLKTQQPNIQQPRWIRFGPCHLESSKTGRPIKKYPNVTGSRHCLLPWIPQSFFMVQRENGGKTLKNGGPLIINPIYTLYSGYLLGISQFKRACWGAKQLGALHPMGTRIFPMNGFHVGKYTKPQRIFVME